MSKISVPINLTSYHIETPGVTRDMVEAQLRANLAWITGEQQKFYENKASSLIMNMLEESTVIKGSVNSMGRALKIKPAVDAVYQPFNLAEMFRAVIVSKLGLLTQQEGLKEVILELDDPTVTAVQSRYLERYPFLKRISSQYVKRTIERIVEVGTLDSMPKPSAVLPFWATDTHYSKLKRDGRKVFFSFKVQDQGVVTLAFTLPRSKRFEGDKVTRPTVFVNKKGKLTFGFTVQKPAPKPQSSTSIMGVDLGRKTPFVGTIVSKQGQYSQPVMPGRRVNKLSEKIEKLDFLGALLFAKEQLNSERGHDHKALILEVERKRVKAKKSRLKKERTQAVARHITMIAEEHNALVVLEDLSWVPHSRWEQSLTSEAITHAARTRGVRTRKVNPKNTSQDCNRCGQKVKHSKRAARCVPCARTLDRDVLASRNIAKRAGAVLKYQVPLRTRVAEPVTTGHLTNYVHLTTRLVT